MKLVKTDLYLLLINEEAEIKEGDYYHWQLTNTVQINKLFEEDKKLGRKGPKGNVSKVIAYYPLNSEVKELDLPLLPNPFKITKSVECLAEEKADEECQIDSSLNYAGFYKGFISGYKAVQQSNKQYSLQDIEQILFDYDNVDWSKREHKKPTIMMKEWLKEKIQSLSTQRLPKEFEPIMYPKYTQYYGFEEDDEIPVMTPMTSTNSEGKQEIQGKYIWCRSCLQRLTCMRRAFNLNKILYGTRNIRPD